MTDVFRVSNPDASTWEQLTARDVLERAVARIESDLTEQPLLRASILGSLANAYTGLGRYDEARGLHEESLALQRDTLGRNDLAYAGWLASYAGLLRKQANYAGALAAAR
jgi:tetratricopeptide (TPR) repeat protein